MTRNFIVVALISLLAVGLLALLMLNGRPDLRRLEIKNESLEKQNALLLRQIELLEKQNGVLTKIIAAKDAELAAITNALESE